MQLDVESVPIKVDNCCTQLITGYMSNIVPGTVREVTNKQVRGFSKTISKIASRNG
jgi:hypothetical protein